MQCPSCGLQIDQQNLKWCPRCGQMLATASAPVANEPPGRRLSQYLHVRVRKLNRRLIVGVIVAVGVLLVACTGATLWGMRLTAQTTVLDPDLATATARANPPSPSVSIGGVIYQNTFASNDKGWRDNEDDCYLGNDGYHVTSGYSCFAPIGSLTNVDITADAEQVSGPSTNLYGIVFRADGSGSSYQFLIDSSGEWVLYLCKSYNCVTLVALTHNDAIHGSFDTMNTLEAHAKGSHFDLFVNGVKVGSCNDTTLIAGRVGLSATTDVESVFTNLVIKRA